MNVTTEQLFSMLGRLTVENRLMQMQIAAMTAKIDQLEKTAERREAEKKETVNQT